MKELTEQSPDARPSRLKIHVVTVVWGRAHVDALVSLTWRSLLAAGNLPAFASRFETTYDLTVGEENIPTVIDSPAYKEISRFVPVDLHSFSEATAHADKYERHWILWRAAVDRARRHDAMVLLIIPDVLYADGTLARWGGFLDAGKRAVFCIGTWVSEETFLPEFRNLYPENAGIAAAVPQREMMRLMLTHAHPLIAASFRDSGHGIFHAERITTGVPGEGFASRMLTSQPFIFATRDFHADATGCPLDHFEDMICDDVSFLSVGPMLHLAEFYHEAVPFDARRMSQIGGWSLGNIRPAHIHESRFDYVYARDDGPRDPDSWRKASATLDDMRREILSAHAVGQVCQKAHDLGCYMAWTLIAMAALRSGLNRAVSTDGAYTVFLPADNAFENWPEEFLFALFCCGTSPAILDMMRDHVAPERLYLKVGDAIAPVDGGDRAADFRALSGRQLAVYPKGQPAPSAAVRIVGGQVRVGYGTVYIVDRVISRADGSDNAGSLSDFTPVTLGLGWRSFPRRVLRRGIRYMKRLARAAASGGLVIASFLVALGIAEVALRSAFLPDPWTIRNFLTDPVNQQVSNIAIQYDPVIGYIAKPNFRGGPYNTQGQMGIRLNHTLGPNDPSPPIPTGGILASGDSFTYGSEVKDDESWPAQLEDMLHVPVVNGGAGGYGVDQAVLRAEQLLDVVKPKVIIIELIPNMMGRNQFSINTGLMKSYFDVVDGKLELRNVPVPPYQPSIHHVGLARMIFGYSYAVDWAAGRMGVLQRWQEHKYETRQVHENGAEVSCLLYKRLADRVAGRGIKLVALAEYAGIHVNGHDNARDSYQVPRVLACAKEAGYIVVDSYPVLRERYKEDPISFWNLWVKEPDDHEWHTGHPSASGNRLIAELLAQALGPLFPGTAAK